MLGSSNAVANVAVKNLGTAKKFYEGTLGLKKVDEEGDEVIVLKEKGVTFEHYDMPNMKLEGDIHVSGNMKVAWFKDPDGNILNIIKH